MAQYAFLSSPLSPISISPPPTAYVTKKLTIRQKGKLPALGWNSWNAFSCDINETKILTAANQIVSLGLKDAGYEYVNSMSPFLLFVPRFLSQIASTDFRIQKAGATKKLREEEREGVE
jgi:hypothetical protein